MEQQNISYIIFETINNLLNNLLSSIDTTLYEILDELAFIDTNILKISFFEKICYNLLEEIYLYEKKET